jgi:hypothetical protein
MSGVNLQHHGDDLIAAVPFLALTLLIAALPLLANLLLGRRAKEAMPKVRDWMTSKQLARQYHRPGHLRRPNPLLNSSGTGPWEAPGLSAVASRARPANRPRRHDRVMSPLDEVAPGLWRWTVIRNGIPPTMTAYALRDGGDTILVDPLGRRRERAAAGDARRDCLRTRTHPRHHPVPSARSGGHPARSALVDPRLRPATSS